MSVNADKLHRAFVSVRSKGHGGFLGGAVATSNQLSYDQTFADGNYSSSHIDELGRQAESIANNLAAVGLIDEKTKQYLLSRASLGGHGR